MDSATIQNTLVGMIMPVVIALVNQHHWSPKVKGLVALISCLVVATVVELFRGDVTWTDWRNTAMVVFGTAVVMYNMWWRPSQIAPAVEASTSTGPALTSSGDESG